MHKEDLNIDTKFSFIKNPEVEKVQHFDQVINAWKDLFLEAKGKRDDAIKVERFLHDDSDDEWFTSTHSNALEQSLAEIESDYESKLEHVKQESQQALLNKGLFAGGHTKVRREEALLKSFFSKPLDEVALPRRVEPMPRDASSFFHAMSYELNRQGLCLEGAYDLRSRAVEYLYNTHQYSDAYLYSMLRETTPSDALMISALAFSLNVQLHVTHFQTPGQRIEGFINKLLPKFPKAYQTDININKAGPQEKKAEQCFKAAFESEVLSEKKEAVTFEVKKINPGLGREATIELILTDNKYFDVLVFERACDLDESALPSVCI